MGRYDEALQQYDRILEGYPEQSYPLKLRANLYLRLGRAEEALHDYALVRARPEHQADEVATINSGCVLFCMEDFDGAAALFSRRIEEHPVDFKALCNRAHAHLKAARFDLALEDYVLLRRIYPESVSETMVNALREEPETVAEMILPRNLLFCREHHWEDWMKSPTPFFTVKSSD